MSMIIPARGYEPVEGISYRETDRIGFTVLYSPVLIIVKNEGVHQNEIDTFACYLTPEETEKSRRFRFSHDRDSYIIIHGLLRSMLGRHLGIFPQQVAISYNSFGRPFLEGYSGNVFFNLSHSAGISVLAFDPENEIGVDVEYMDKDFEYDDIVKMFFSKDERKYIRQPEDESRSRFYEIWTRKEAFLKAIGTGIPEHLNVEVLSEKMSKNGFGGRDAVGKEFVFRSILFEQNYRMTLAMGSDSGIIQGFILGNTENGLQLRKG